MSREHVDEPQATNEEATPELSEQDLESVAGGIVGRPRHQGVAVGNGTVSGKVDDIESL